MSGRTAGIVLEDAGGGNFERLVAVGGVAVVVGHCGNDADGDRGDVAGYRGKVRGGSSQRGDIRGENVLIGEGVGADKIFVRHVFEAAVGIKRQNAVRGTRDEDG